MIKALWNAASPLIKVLMVVVLPLLVLMLLFGKGREILGGILEASKRKKVDKELAESEARESKAKDEAMISESKVKDLEKERDEKINTDPDDDADWHNKR